METLVVVAQHRNQDYSRSRAHGTARFTSFCSPPSKEFREINCRTFQSGTGILPTPLKACTSPVAKRSFSASFSPKTPSSINSLFEDQKDFKRSARSSAISIPGKAKVNVDFTREGSFHDDCPFSERWAGPAYSNSPPPSSLPIPKFSLKPKRTVSLELTTSASAIDLHQIAKSAPSSPTRASSPSAREFSDGTDSATKTLRRILNLDICDQ